MVVDKPQSTRVKEPTLLWNQVVFDRDFSCPVTAFEPSRPAADATREVSGSIVA